MNNAYQSPAPRQPLPTQAAPQSNPAPAAPQMRPINQVPMGQIDAARAQTGNAGMPAALPMNATAMSNAPAAAVSAAQGNFAGGMQNRPPMPAQAQRPAAMPAQAQRPAGLPAQAAPQAQANAQNTAQARQQRLAALPVQARDRLRQNVMTRIQPIVQQAEQRMQQLRASGMAPQQIAQAMSQFDQAIAAEEAAAIDAAIGA
jgi:hypothetical protein